MSVQMNLRTRTRTRAADAGTGLLSLAGIAVLVVGVPAALVALVGSPLPAGVPSLSGVAAALRDTYIPDEFLVKLLALVCWLAWLELVASLVVETVAHARGRTAGAVPLAGGLQRAAARLVAGVALLGALAATRGLPAPEASIGRPLAPAAAPVTALVADERPAGEPEAPVVDDAASSAPVYEVQRRDTLWDIAERHLGDPFRWQEIFRLNEGRPQPDGRCLTDPDLIHLGWQLELPTDAVGLSAPEPTASDDPAAEPSASESPASDARGSSVAAGSGMVLVDDGLPDAHGDALLVSEPTPAGSAPAFDGMVLLPDSTGGGTDAPAELASRTDGRPSPPSHRVDDDH